MMARCGDGVSMGLVLPSVSVEQLRQFREAYLSW